MSAVNKARKIARQASRIYFTGKTRSAHGYEVTGPDGKTYHATTLTEAAQNLLARVRCHRPPGWMVRPAKPVTKIQPGGRHE